MVERDAERRQVLALVSEHHVQREPMHALPAVPQRPFREIDQPVDLRVRIGQHAGEIRLSRQVFIREARSNVAHIVAPVTFLRKGDSHVAHLQVTQPDREREDVHLPPGVVHIELARDARAGELEELR